MCYEAVNLKKFEIRYLLILKLGVLFYPKTTLQLKGTFHRYHN